MSPAGIAHQRFLLPIKSVEKFKTKKNKKSKSDVSF